MRRYYLFICLFAILLGCKESSKREDTSKGEKEVATNMCRTNIPPTNDVHFLLSLSLNKCFKNINQTIFVESTDEKVDSNFFALSAQIDPGKYKNGVFKNVWLKDFKFKKLSGLDLYVNEVSEKAKYNASKKQYEIEITLGDEVSRVNNKCKIAQLKTTDRIEIKVYSKNNKHFIGPRICTNYIGSLPKR